MLRDILKKFIDTLLPPRCIGSGEIVEAPGVLSAGFWKELSFIGAPYCETCGMPFGFDSAAGALCAACLESPPSFDRARAAVIYNDASRKIILGFKYGDRLHAAGTFAGMLLRAGGDVIGEADVIAPVPLHPWRLWRRRFNQSALIAKQLAVLAGKTYAAEALARRKHTKPQKGLSRKERAQNMQGAFAPGRNDVRGKVVLLVDDVYTSGATLNACAKALRKAGATRVFVLTVARVTREDEGS